MAVIVWAGVGVAGVVGMFFILRHYRRQADDVEPPGIVPEEY